MMAACEAKLGGQVSPEFLRSQIEVGTPPVRHHSRGARRLLHLRSTIAREAARHGLAPIAASTHPFADAARQLHTDKDRYHALAQRSRRRRPPPRRVRHARAHRHRGRRAAHRPDESGALLPPHLLVLATSSPFWEGEDTGLKSWRLAIFRELPRTGLPGRFGSFDEYRSTVDVLIKAKVIEDASKIWWDLRPSARFPDAGDARHRRVHPARRCADRGRAVPVPVPHAVPPAPQQPELAHLSRVPARGEPLARAALRRRRHAVRLRQGRARRPSPGSSRRSWSSSARTPRHSAARPMSRAPAASPPKGRAPTASSPSSRPRSQPVPRAKRR